MQFVKVAIGGVNCYNYLMARLITYGCSLTNYRWWTWADILAKQLDLPLINRGKPACGNNFIFSRLQHDIDTGLIQPNDTIRIMWCHYNRVSKVLDPDNFIYNSETSDLEEQIQNFKTTINIIQQAEKLLSKYDYEFMTWLPLTQNGEPNSENASMLQATNNPTVESISLDNLFVKKIHPPLIDKVFQGSFTSRIDFAISFNDIPTKIQKNVYKQANKLGLNVIDYIRQNANAGDGRTLMFFDYHPTPLHQFEYLKDIYPEMKWSDDIIKEISQQNQQVLTQIWPEISRVR